MTDYWLNSLSRLECNQIQLLTLQVSCYIKYWDIAILYIVQCTRLLFWADVVNDYVIPAIVSKIKQNKVQTKWLLHIFSKFCFPLSKNWPNIDSIFHFLTLSFSWILPRFQSKLYTFLCSRLFMTYQYKVTFLYKFCDIYIYIISRYFFCLIFRMSRKFTMMIWYE